MLAMGRMATKCGCITSLQDLSVIAHVELEIFSISLHSSFAPVLIVYTTSVWIMESILYTKFRSVPLNVLK